MTRRGSGLVPLKELASQPRAVAEARNERHVSRNWPLIVGPVVSRYTRLIRIHQHTLIIGCWKTDVMASLRQSAAATWPQVRDRLEKIMGLQVHRMEIVPCDPPEPAPPRAVPQDPLETVLRKYRTLRNQGWTTRPK